jgi:hypothetical protein
MNSPVVWKRCVEPRVIDLGMMLENAGSKSGTIVSGGGTSDSTILNINCHRTVD